MYIRVEQPTQYIATTDEVMNKRSDLKANMKNYFLKQFNDQKD